MISPRALFLCAALGLQMLLPPVFAAPGDLDLTFGRTGKFTTDFGSVSDQGRSVAVQGDGRIVVTGKVDGPNDLDVGIARYLADGTLDPSFGAGGKVVTDFGGGNDSGEAVAIQNDGKIVVACLAYDGGNPRIGVARYLTNGTLDPAFNGTGQVITVLGTHDGAQAVAIQGDGKIVVAGFATVGSFTDFAVVRYEANGTLDTGFGTGGSVITDIGTINDEATSVALQADGKIVAAGYADIGSFVDFAVLRYEADGDLDPTWNTSGIVVTDISGQIDQTFAVVVQQDQKIVVAGVSNTGSDHDYALARYTTTGALDGTFGSGGQVVVPRAGEQFLYGLAVRPDGKLVATGFTDSGLQAETVLLRFDIDGALDLTFGTGGEAIIPVTMGHDHGNGIALQGDERIVVAGFAETGPDSDYSVVRCLSNGHLDVTFGPGTGKVTTAIGNGNDGGESVVLQADGKIVVAGYFYNGADDDFALVRYHPDGTFDTTFGGDGKVTTDIAGDNDQALGLAIQPDGKIVAAGYADGGGDYDFAVVRYLPDGSLDSDFGSGGKVTTAIGSGHDYGGAIALQEDGKIVVVGQSYNGINDDFAIVRYNADGSLDTSFNTTGKIVKAIGGDIDRAVSVAVQSDGKIVVGGPSHDGGAFLFALVRYLSNGSLDTAFNGTGQVTTDILSGHDYATDLALQNDGKIVLVGRSNPATPPGAPNDFSLVRYNPDGSLDTTFNGTGKVTTDFAGLNDEASSVAIQSDGKIIVVGVTFIGSDSDIALSRYGVNGTIDSSFGSGGKVTTTVGSADDSAHAVALQSDGKTVLVARFFNGSNNDFAVVRFLGGPEPTAVTAAAKDIQAAQATLGGSVNPNGQSTLFHYEYGTDPALAGATNTSGVNIGNGTDAILADEPVTGLRPNTTYYFRVVGTNPEGSGFGSILSFTTLPSAPAVTTLAPDNLRSFTARLHAMVDAYGAATTGHFEYGTDSTLTTATSTSNVSLGSAQGTVPLDQTIAGLELGRTYYVRAVASNATGTSLGTILSFTTAAVAGDADPTFDLAAGAAVLSSAVQADGKVLVGGYFTSLDGRLRNRLARFNTDGTLDLTYGPFLGTATLPSAFCLLVQPDGKLLVGGSFANAGGFTRHNVARFNADGSLDTSFINPQVNDIVLCMAQQSDGKIVIGGHFTMVDGVAHGHVARLNADGSVDPSFTLSTGNSIYTVAVQPDGKILLGGANGFARFNADGSVDVANNLNGAVETIAVQPDGKIVLGGNFSLVGAVARSRVARLNADCSLDPGFNPGANAEVFTTVLQADGRIILGGAFSAVGGMTRNRIARLEADGTTDATFDPNVNFTVHSAMLRPDGRIVIGGDFLTINGLPRTRLAQLVNDAAPQSLSVQGSNRVEWLRGGASPEAAAVNFDLSTDGGMNWSPLGAGVRIAGGWELTGLSLPAAGAIRARARTPGGKANDSMGVAETVTLFPRVDPSFVAGTDAAVQNFAVQPDGKTIIGGGFTTVGATPRRHLARLLADGSLESGFDPNVTGSVEEINATLVQADGGIVFGGAFTTVGGVPRNRLARLNADGSLDTGFDPDLNGAVFSIAEQKDGKFLVAGNFTFVGAVARERIARFHADGTLDAAFDPGIVGPGSEAYCLAVQDDGKILVGGFIFTVAGASRPYLARLNADGTLDAAFDPQLDSVVYSLAVQADGRIVIGGSFSNIAGVARPRIARLAADGTLDATFTPNPDNEVDALALQADGRILIAGLFFGVDGFPRRGVARINADGSLDTGFDVGADSYTYGLALQADGRILLGGGFTMLGGVAHDHLARLNNDPATQAITVSGLSRVQWLRGGASPEAQWVSFDLSIDGGTNFTPLGAGTRIAGGWELTGLSLPGGGQIRARARTRSGIYNGSSGLVESVAAYQFVAGQLATDVTATGATLNGLVNPKGVATTAHFEYSTAANLTGATSTSDMNLGSGNGGVPVQASVNTLTPSTTYFYRVVAVTGGATIYGDILSFTTTGAAPGVTTQPATSESSVAVLLHGMVVPKGQATQGRFEYGTDPGLAGASTTGNVSLGSAQTAVALDQVVSGLTPSTTYFFRAVATNATGAQQGTILSFTTLPARGPTWDLSADWSDSVNPNDVWSYLVDGAIGADAGPRTGDSFGPLGPPHVWGQNGIYGWSKSIGSEVGGFPVDVQLGDVYGHTGSGGADDLVIAWTSPIKGSVEVKGGVWPARDIGRSNTWAISVDGVVQASGGVADGDVFNRANPAPFEFTVNIEVGDVVKLSLAKTSGPGDYVGVNFTVTAQDVIVPTGPGVPVPGVPGAVFVDFGSPAVDAGQVGGAATIREPGKKAQTVIFGDTTGTVLARTGVPTDDGITFLSLGDPVFAGEGFGFTGVARVNATPGPPLLIDPRLGVADLLRVVTPGPGARLAGLFSQIARASGIKQLARQGGSAPGVSGGTFTKLPTFGLPRKRAGLVFTGNLKRGNGVTKANDFGVWRETAVAGESELIVRHGETIGTAPAVQKLELMIPVANATDQRRSFAPDGGLAASAKLAGGVIGVVRVMADGTKDVPIDSTTDVPGLPGARFSKVSAPATGNRGIAAFHAALRAAAAGQPPPASQVIVTNRDGAFRTVVRIGESIPGNNAQRFSRLGQPLMGQDGLLAFIASLKGTGVTKRNGTALVQINGNDERRVIARLGDPAPGFEPGAVFQRLQSVVVTDTLKGHIVFTGLVSGGGVAKRNRQALWSVSGDDDVKLLLRGDQLVTIGADTPRLRVFDALTAKPASKGQGRSTDDVGFVTAKVKLSDGRSGVLRIPLP